MKREQQRAAVALVVGMVLAVFVCDSWGRYLASPVGDTDDDDSFSDPSPAKKHDILQHSAEHWSHQHEEHQHEEYQHEKDQHEKDQHQSEVQEERRRIECHEGVCGEEKDEQEMRETLRLLAKVISARSPYDSAEELQVKATKELFKPVTGGRAAFHRRMHDLFASAEEEGMGLSAAHIEQLVKWCYEGGVLLVPLLSAPPRQEDGWLHGEYQLLQNHAALPLLRGPASYFAFSTLDFDHLQLYVTLSSGAPYLHFLPLRSLH